MTNYPLSKYPRIFYIQYLKYKNVKKENVILSREREIKTDQTSILILLLKQAQKCQQITAFPPNLLTVESCLYDW